MLLFLKGLIIGLAIAAPVGPIGILCIQRTLHDGFKIGLMTGLGAAFADGVYGLIAGFGLTAVSNWLVHHQSWIKLIGGIFLIYLGIKLLVQKPEETKSSDYERSAWHACSTTFLLTLANPATILFFLAIFAALGLGTSTASFFLAFELVLGIFIGSAIWWLGLSSIVGLVLHHRINQKIMRIINIVSGAIIILFGIFAFFSVFMLHN